MGPDAGPARRARLLAYRVVAMQNEGRVRPATPRPTGSP